MPASILGITDIPHIAGDEVTLHVANWCKYGCRDVLLAIDYGLQYFLPVTSCRIMVEFLLTVIACAQCP